jgi:hypothetical protein
MAVERSREILRPAEAPAGCPYNRGDANGGDAGCRVRVRQQGSATRNGLGRPAAVTRDAPTTVDAPVDAGFAAWPATLEDRTVELAWHELRATITGRVPVGWIASGKSYFHVPDGGNPSPMDPSISYSFGNMSCDGECDDGDMQNSMVEMWDAQQKLYAQVSYNSGNERMDNMKLDVKTLEQGAFSDGAYKAGKYMAVKITRPTDAQDLPTYLDRFEATCMRHRKGDRFYIIASVRMRLEHQQLWALMLEACKTPWFR